MEKNKLHTITDSDAEHVARLLLKSHLPYTYNLVKITRLSYEEQHGVDAEESVNVHFEAVVSNDAYRKSGWEDKEVMVQLIERDRYHDHPYFHANGRKSKDKPNHYSETVFLANQIEAIEFLQEKKYV